MRCSPPTSGGISEDARAPASPRRGLRRNGAKTDSRGSGCPEKWHWTETALKTVDEDVNPIPRELRAKMLEHGAHTASGETRDPDPVVRLHVFGTNASWLLTELDPDDADLAWGLCDEGLGSPRLDHVRLSDLVALFGDELRLDTEFASRQSLSSYGDEAKARGTIVP